MTEMPTFNIIIIEMTSEKQQHTLVHARTQPGHTLEPPRTER